MLGYRFCLRQVGLTPWPLRVESRLGERRAVEREGDQHLVQVYPPLQALPTEGESAIFTHLEFALRHEGVDLAALAGICAALEPQLLAAWISSHPSGKYARRLGFLYEWLTGRQLPLDPTLIAGAYEPVLDAGVYFTGPVTNVPRWHVRNNLPGTPAWCPTVHRETLGGVPVGTLDVAAELRQAHAALPPAIFAALLTHAYAAEVQASYAIAGDAASPAQREAFERVLRTAGAVSLAARLANERLIELQGAIFSGSGAWIAYGVRRDETFVGSTGNMDLQRVEYPCPPARALGSLLAGLQQAAAERLAAPALPPIVCAAVVSFGFDFIHPLMQGNGRIHRFLVQAALLETGALAPGTIVPVSPVMLARLPEYAKALRAYFAPVRATAEALAGVRVILEPRESFSFPHYERVAPLYRYPVLTEQVSYLESAVRQGLDADLKELETLSHGQRLAHAPQLGEVALPDAQAAAAEASSARLRNPAREESVPITPDDSARKR